MIDERAEDNDNIPQMEEEDLEAYRRQWEEALLLTVQEERQRSAFALETEKERFEQVLAGKDREIEKLKEALAKAREKSNDLEQKASELSSVKTNQTPGAPSRKRARIDDNIRKKKESAVKSKHKLKWEAKVQSLIRFKDIHGHCCVGIQENKNNFNAEWKELAQWVTDVRTRYRFTSEGKPNGLSAERIRQLTAIGFQWSAVKTKVLSFAERLEQLKVYKEKCGDVDVPQKYSLVEGLGNFVLEQRRRYKSRKELGDAYKGSLTDERIARLDELGFNWRLRDRNDNRVRNGNHNMK